MIPSNLHSYLVGITKDCQQKDEVLLSYLCPSVGNVNIRFCDREKRFACSPRRKADASMESDGKDQDSVALRQ